MSISATRSADRDNALRAPLAFWVGAGMYALFVLAGNHLLIDPDTMWQVTVGRWILDHGTVPTVDLYSFTMRGQPWISTQWLAQAAYAAAYTLAGWTGPVVLASMCIAATYAMLARYLARHLNETTALVLVAAALVLCILVPLTLLLYPPGRGGNSGGSR